MSNPASSHQVFLSHARADTALARAVAQRLVEAGVKVFVDSSTAVEATQRALAECDAVLVLVTAAGALAPSLAIDVGSAIARHKAVYLLVDEESVNALPDHLRRFSAYPISRLDDVVPRVVAGSMPISEAQRRVLIRVYQKLGIPTDRLLFQPMAVDQLTREFNRASKTDLPGERLVRELLRLRKSGELPAIKREAKPRSAVRRTA